MSEADEMYVDELEGKVDGLENDLNSLLHASMKCAIRNNDERLKDFINLNYNSFVKEKYPEAHESIEVVRVKP